MIRRFDVVVVGGSLAGASAAKLLSEAGLSVALFDKTTFPRRKPCGEGLTSYGLKQLHHLGLRDAVLKLPHIKYSGYKVISGRKSFWIQSPWGDGIAIRRYELDNLILQTSLQHPLVTPFINRSVDCITPTSVVSNSETIEADFIVIADGAGSKLSEQLGFQKTQKGEIRTGVSVTFCGNFSELPTSVTIIVNNGYEIYCTPVSELRLNVSVLAPQSKNTNVRDLLLSSETIHQVFRETGFRGELEGQPIGRTNLGNIRRTSHYPSVYLAGDALEEFDPIGGLGMTHALRSGIFAAKCIIERSKLSTMKDTRGWIPAHEQLQFVQPMRTFTSMCYRTFRASEKFPFLLRAAGSTLGRHIMKSVTREFA